MRKRFLSLLSTRSLPYKRASFIGRPTLASPSRRPDPHRSGSPTDSSRQRRRKEEEDPHIQTEIKTTRANFE
jgi:hypothetical protein